MRQIDALHFEGRDWTLEAAEIDPALLSDLLYCAGSGDAEPAVRMLMDTWTVEGNPADCRDMLRPYGAWEDDELDDHDENLRRLVWLTGCALAEGEPAYFSGY